MNEEVRGMAESEATAPIAGQEVQGTPFVNLVFHGERFAAGVIPVDVLPELAAYRDAIVAAAKGLFRKEHYGRRRVPKGFEASIRLVLAGAIYPGSAVAEVRRLPSLHTPGTQATLPVPDEVDGAVEYVERWFAAAVNDSALPDDLALPDQRRVERALASIGRHLLSEEALETRTNQRLSGARFTFEARRKLAERTGRRDIEVDFDSLSGVVVAVTVSEDGQTFTLDLGDQGVHSSIAFDPDRHDPLSIVAPHGRPIPVTVNFSARVDAHDFKVTRIEDVSSLVVEDSDLDIGFERPDRQLFLAAIAEFEAMGDGWFDGIGHAPTTESLEWARAPLLQACVENDVALPWLYPTPEGGVRAEWEAGALRASAVYDPEDGVLRLVRVNLETDDVDEDSETPLAEAASNVLTAFVAALAT